jgi:hypothetical protein
MPVAQPRGQVAPWQTRARNPQHRFDKQPVVLGGYATVGRLARNEVLDPLLLVISQ